MLLRLLLLAGVSALSCACVASATQAGAAGGEAAGVDSLPVATKSANAAESGTARTFGTPNSAMPAMSFKGRLQQGSLLVGKVEPGVKMFLDDKPLRVGADGTVVFGLDRDAPEKVRLQVVRADGLAFSTVYAIAPRQYNIQRVEGISERVMNPNPEDEKRIAAESELTKQARARDDERLDFLQTFIWPVQGPITGVYGSQRFYNGVAKRPHYGVDVGVPTGTPIVAPAAGIVTLAHPDMFYSGGTLIIDHGFGVSSTLMHLSEVLVKEGARVEQGQLVAKSGASGRASGPHLDWRMNWFDQRIDPQQFVPKMPVKK